MKGMIIVALVIIGVIVSTIYLFVSTSLYRALWQKRVVLCFGGYLGGRYNVVLT